MEVALDKVTNSTKEFLQSNKKGLQNVFDDLYSNDRALLYKIFQSDENGLTILNNEQHKVLFDNLQTKQKCNLYNTISLDARDS